MIPENIAFVVKKIIKNAEKKMMKKIGSSPLEVGCGEVSEPRGGGECKPLAYFLGEPHPKLMMGFFFLKKWSKRN